MSKLYCETNKLNALIPWVYPTLNQNRLSDGDLVVPEDAPVFLVVAGTGLSGLADLLLVLEGLVEDLYSLDVLHLVRVEVEGLSGF